MSEAKLDPLTPAELDELERLEREASPGEWAFNGYSCVYSIPRSDEFNRRAEELPLPTSSADCDPRWGELPETDIANVPTVAGDTGTKQGQADAEFIAAARNALPRLLAMAREALRLENELKTEKLVNDVLVAVEKERVEA